LSSVSASGGANTSTSQGADTAAVSPDDGVTDTVVDSGDSAPTQVNKLPSLSPAAAPVMTIGHAVPQD
jgi:hypothetical protein